MDIFDFPMRYFVAIVDNTHIGYKNQNIGHKNERWVYMT
jgi:hypothetical protein